MDDFARTYRGAGGDYDRGRRSEIQPYSGGVYDRGCRDYDQGIRKELVLYTGGAGATNYDRGYRNEFRSIGAGAGNRRLEIVRGNVYSANQTYVTRPPPNRSPDPPPVPSSSSSTGVGLGAWCFSDPEMKRRRRVVSYKVYSVEGKVKQSIRRRFRWFKGKCSEMVYRC